MKRNNIFIFLIFLFILSCGKGNKEEFYYPTLKEFETIENKDIILLNSFSNFKVFKSEMWHYYRRNPGKNPVILLKDNNHFYFIKYADKYGCIPPIIKLKNVIGVSKDSIYKWNEFYPVDSLEQILKNDLMNYGRNNKLADNPKSLVIQLLNPEKESIEDIENNLTNLCRIYNKIKSETKDSLELNIEFEELIIMKSPPLPNREE